VHRVCGTSDPEIEWGYVGPVGYMTVNTGGSAQAELSGRLGVSEWSPSSEQLMRPRQMSTTECSVMAARRSESMAVSFLGAMSMRRAHDAS
jgi:hypothetical protein